MKKRWLLILILLSLGLNIGLLTWITNKKISQTPVMSGCQPGACNWRQSPLRHDLKLTLQQTEKLETAYQELQKTIKPLQDELQKKRAALASLLKTDPVPLGELEQLITAITANQADIERHYILHFLQIKSMLNESQQRRMFDNLEKSFCPAISSGFSSGCEQTSHCSQTVCAKKITIDKDK